MGKEREKWMGGGFLGKRREKILGLRLLLSRATWKDADHLGGEEYGKKGRLGEMREEEGGGKMGRRSIGEQKGGHSRGGRAEEEGVQGGRNTALRARYLKRWATLALAL